MTCARYQLVSDSVVIITPQTAQHLIDCSNRLEPSTYKLYRIITVMMTSWNPEESLIVLGVAGEILDGLHRLTACCLLGTTIKTQLRLVSRL